MLKRSSKKKCFRIGASLGVCKSIWVVLSKNIFSFPKGPLFCNCEAAKFGDLANMLLGKML
jgi:hypothetical protein